MIYDMPDSYLEIDDSTLQARLRGTAKYLFRQHRHFEPDYKRTLKAMFARADCVTCSTVEQREKILAYNSNVHPILDFHTKDATAVKTVYARSDASFHLVWEGMGLNLVVFEEVRTVLAKLARKHKIVLHLVTDLWHPAFNGPVPEMPTRNLIRKLRREVPVLMYEWNPFMVAQIVTKCDLALIPIAMNHPVYFAKPENKLLLLWRMGMPTITSATPAYIRTMKQAGLPMYAETRDDWARLLEHYIDDEAARRFAGETGRRFAEEAQGEAVLLKRWDAVYESTLARSGAR